MTRFFEESILFNHWYCWSRIFVYV